MKQLFILVLCMLSSMGIYAQNQPFDSDFANKIRPENKLDLSVKKPSVTTSSKATTPQKSKAELELELAHFQNQKKKVEQAIADLEKEGVSKEDAQYVKYQMSRKWLINQIRMRQKALALPAKCDKK